MRVQAARFLVRETNNNINSGKDREKEKKPIFGIPTRYRKGDRCLTGQDTHANKRIAVKILA